MRRLNTIIAVIIALAIIVGVLYGLWLGVRAFGTLISSQESQVAAAIIAACATVFVGLGAVVFSQQRSKTREISESHRPKKIGSPPN